MNTADRVLFLLKTRGAQTAQELADQLELTSMGARKHLESWHDKGLVTFEDSAEKQGRPRRRWQLSEAGHAHFPDRHGDLTVQVLQHVRQLFGEQGINRLITTRELETLDIYTIATNKVKTLKAKLKVLAEIRSQEGYMAEILPHENEGYLLVENHCPIRAAAKECQQFCRSELSIFQQALGDNCVVERTEHLQSGARRCVYWVKSI
ncbi:helix-turn-helix transcriptional regulator [Undibacterium sp. Ji22W]|uniref:helix-turn-helix transcriptional regulator n=1 Tax=Undibacterium sp. Ji22W TaxID=3413038 RepID=UPI003BEF9E54